MHDALRASPIWADFTIMFKRTSLLLQQTFQKDHWINSANRITPATPR